MLAEEQKKFNEEGCRKLFDRYHTDKSEFALSKEDLRRFLFDLLEARGLKAIVPEEALTAVLRTLMLNYDNSSSSVTWLEWKSFFCYLQNTPLEVILSKVAAPYEPKDLKDARFYVLRSKIYTEIPNVEELKTSLNEGREDRPLYLSLDFADYRVYVCQPGKNEDGGEALSFENVAQRFEVKEENLEQFPPHIPRQPGLEHQAVSSIASTWCKASNFMAGKTQEISEWDQNNLKVKDNVKNSLSFAKSLWSSSGIGGFLSTTAAKVNSMVDEVDSQLGVRDKVKKAKEDAAANVSTMKETILSNPTVATAVNKSMSRSETFVMEMKRQINKEKFENSPGKK